MKVTTQSVLFIHGAGGDAWQWSKPIINSLKENLGTAYKIVFPKMPHAGNPSYESWKAALEKDMNAAGDNAILIGHSLGGSVVLKYMIETTESLGCKALFLLAPPYWGEEGWESDDFKITNSRKRLDQLPIFLYQNQDDGDVPFSHQKKYLALLPNAHVASGEHGGHAMLNLLPDVAKKIKSLS